jgi:hypothetical protein
MDIDRIRSRWRTKKKQDYRQPDGGAFVLWLLVDRAFIVKRHIGVPAGEEGSSSDCAFQILQRQYGITPRSESRGSLQTKSQRLIQLAFSGIFISRTQLAPHIEGRA